MLLRHTLNLAAYSLAEALVHFWEAREKEKRTPVEGVGWQVDDLSRRMRPARSKFMNASFHLEYHLNSDCAGKKPSHDTVFVLLVLILTLISLHVLRRMSTCWQILAVSWVCGLVFRCSPAANFWS